MVSFPELAQCLFGKPTERKKIEFHGRYSFVTWSRSSFRDKDAFQRALISLLPPGTKYFGGKEPQYHVVFKFENKVYWVDARGKFTFPGDTSAIRFRKSRPRKPIADFCTCTQGHCAKHGDTFGERFGQKPSASERKKRTSPKTNDEPDPARTASLIRKRRDKILSELRSMDEKLQELEIAEATIQTKLTQ